MTETTQTTQIRTAIPQAGARISWGRLKQVALGLTVVAGTFAVADYGRYYWTTVRYLVTTDDAHVDVHSAIISPKVAGYISDVPVTDNQHVKASFFKGLMNGAL